MRTTVTIDDHLLEGAKREAARTRRRLGDVLDDALRVHLAERRRDPRPVTLTTYGRGGLLPGVDLDDKDAMAVLLGDEDPPRAAD